ncbi:plasmid replication, integration and excision activator [Pseudonocardia nantongensis]|uniref:plasmid replication, integration and excision activator n=1 Tax=Pseudonocardia nantongensis TaxID=1181885 RepID=UPI0039793D42
MAIKNKFPVAMGDVFPHGAFVVSEVEPVRDFDKSAPGRPVQQNDKESGLPVWSVSVLDADPEARRADKTVTVKIAATHQPVPPEAAAGLPFRPVEFDGLTVTPYVQENGSRPRVAYSFRAAGMRAPAHQRPASSQKNQEAA